MKKSSISTVSILGVQVSQVSRREALEILERWAEGKAKKMVVTPNPEQMVMAQKDESFKENLNGAALALPDGVGLVWASKVLGWLNPPSGLRVEGSTLKERVTGEEVMREMIFVAMKKGWRVMLVGGKPGVAADAAKKTQNLELDARGRAGKTQNYNSKFKITGIEGHRNIRKYTREENEKVIGEINRFRPDMLFVGYGAPWQEKWLASHLKFLDVKVSMVVGGALDMIVDPSLKPPELMTSLRLDWFYRLVRQPWRLGRQLALGEFVWLVMRERVLSS